MRSLFFFLFVFGIIPYYTVTAVYTGLLNVDDPVRQLSLIAFAFISLGALASLILYSRWSANWPSTFAKHTVHTGITALLGLILMAMVMLVGDLIVGFGSLLSTLQASWAETEPAFVFSRQPVMGRISILAGGLLTLSLLYGVFRRYRYRLRTVQIPIKDLPKAFHGLRIVQLSDIHSGSFDNPEAVAKGVDMALALHPDLIVFTGDLVNNHAAEFKPYLDIFAKLRAPLGVYSVLGNHDYGDYIRWPSTHAKQANLDTLKEYQRLAGWRLLMNESVTIQKNGDSISLAGVENWSLRSNFPRHGRLNDALVGIPSDRPTILLSHDPSHWVAEVVKSHPQIVLTLSGHTHGMQFGFESRWFKWSPVQYFYKEWAGLYQRGQQYLYVNRGFGFIGYLGRLGMAPEITLLELVAKED